jgi:hypothetical protein
MPAIYGGSGMGNLGKVVATQAADGHAGHREVTCRRWRRH